MLREYQTTYCTTCAVQRSPGFSRYRYRVFPCQGAGEVLLNVGEVLCGGVPRGSHRLRRRNSAAVGWFVSFGMARYYHMEWVLSTPFSTFPKFFFAPPPVSCSTCLHRAPRPVPTQRPSRCPVHALPDRAAPVSVLCRLLTYHGIGDGLHRARHAAERTRRCHHITTSRPISTSRSTPPTPQTLPPNYRHISYRLSHHPSNHQKLTAKPHKHYTFHLFHTYCHPLHSLSNRDTNLHKVAAYLDME